MNQRRRYALIAAALLAVPSLALSQNRQNNNPNRPPAPPQAQHPAILKKYVAEHTSKTEQELADLIQRRSATRASDMPYLDLQIDLRILSRWLGTAALSADPMSDTQAVAWLRLRDMQTVCATVDAWTVKQVGTAPAKPQADAMKAITQATYKLPPDVGSSGAIDSVLTPLRAPLLIALGDAKGNAPDMRPPNPSPTTGPSTQPKKDEPPAPAAAPLTLDQINGRVTQLQLSPPLRQQLLAAVAAAKQAQGEEATTLTEMLRRSMDTVLSMQSDISVDPAARADMEQKLGQAVSLFTDPRLRDVADKTFDELSRYRESAAKMSAVGLPRDKMQSLAPVFAYARAHPQDQQKLFDAVTKFATLEKEIGEIKPPAMTVLGARQLDAQMKLYATAREAFLAECEGLANAGGGAFAADASGIPTRADDLDKVASFIKLLARLPQTQERLLTLKPRPTGAFEKRLVQTLVKLSDNDPTQKANAQTLLLQVDEIASAWADAQEATANPIEPEAFKALAGRGWPEIEVKLKTTAIELTTSIAAGNAPDTTKLNMLRQAKSLLSDVRKIVDLRAKLASATALARWADCNLTQEKIDALLELHRADYGPVLAASLEGDSDEKALRQQQQRYRGLLSTLNRAADRAAGCESLPADARGLIGRLTTHSEKAPHASIRFLSFASDLIDFARAAPETDPNEINELQNQMLATLNRMTARN